MPIKQRIDLLMRYIFPPYDKRIRYFSKYLINILRVLSVMLISYQPSFGHYSPVFYVVHYIIEFCFLMDIFMKMRTGFIDEYGECSPRHDQLKMSFCRILHIEPVVQGCVIHLSETSFHEIYHLNREAMKFQMFRYTVTRKSCKMIP